MSDCVVTPTPRRISVRLQKLPPSHLKVLPQKEKITPSPKQRKIQKNKKHRFNDTLTEEERTQLRKDVVWLDEMETYLKDEENLSWENYSSVMLQVEKLASAKGITYPHWAAGTYFYKGSQVTLSYNFYEMLEEAGAFEDEHGRDKGNGTYGHDDYGTTTTRRHC